MKRTHVYLDPMIDGKPGVVRELSYNEEPVQFLEPVNPYTGSDLSKLRSAVSDAETALRHAISRGAGSSEVSKLDIAVTTAKRDLDIVEYELRRERQRQQVGADSPFSRNESRSTVGQQLFMEPVPYFTRNEDNAASDELKAKVKAAVDALEKAISAEAPQEEIAKLQENLRVLREQLQNPFQAPRTDDPPRKERIGERPTGSKNTLAEFAASVKAAVEPPTPAAPVAVKKTESRLAKWIREVWEPQQAKRMLEKLRQDGTTIAETSATPAPSMHSARVCCTGRYLCDMCRKKAAA